MIRLEMHVGKLLENCGGLGLIAIVASGSQCLLERGLCGTESTQIRQGHRRIGSGHHCTERIALGGEKLLGSAESGQRVVQVYDDIMARAISAFGQT